jgi:hypothetical protein
MRATPAIAVAAVLIAVLTAGCGGVKPTTPVAPARESPPAAPPAAATPETKAPEPAPVARAEPAPLPPPATPPTAADQGKAQPEPAAKPAAKAATAPAQASPKKEAAREPKKETAPEPATPKAEPPLDLASLETRLKETKAIGIMTKIALKNQVDDLLNQFRGFYAGKVKTTLAELRKAYDLLVLKVLSLLQDSDPSLAAAIVASREAIWGILSDPVKFAHFATN